MKIPLAFFLALLALLTVAKADTIIANFTSADTIPVTAASYTATGNDVSLSLGYAPAVGTCLMVVKNTGLAFIQGRFSNLAQGQAVSLTYNSRIYQFIANYYGGSSNDLVLQWANSNPVAWGHNNYGQLGNNSTTDSSVPVYIYNQGVLYGKKVTAIAGGFCHNLALCSDGTVVAWGLNSSGQLGNSTTTNSSVPVSVTFSGVLSGKFVVAVSAGNNHSLALCSDGTLAAWGDNTYGELGNNSTTASSVPVQVTQSGVLAGKSVVTVATGRYTSFALCSDGSMAAWGFNSSGQLGNNSTTNSNVPVAVNNSGVLADKTVICIASAYNHSLALCSDGTVAAWGSNDAGQLGNNSNINSSVPVVVTKSGVLTSKTVVAIAACQGTGIALCSDNSMAAWGQNNVGQLGDNTTTYKNQPVSVIFSGALAGKTFVSVTGSADNSAASCSDGTVATWGGNGYGTLGNNSTTNSLIPVSVSTAYLGLGVRLVSPCGTSIGSHMLAMAATPLISSLSSLAISTGTLSPTFAAATTSYTASVPNATTSITVTPTVTDATATLKVNGMTVVSGAASGAITLTVGNNPITVLVTAQDGSTTSYTITVNRISTVSTLSTLTLSAGNLSPTFASGTKVYTASVANATTAVTVTPTVTHSAATVKVNGVSVVSGAASAAIPVAVGSNVITIQVAAQDVSFTTTYTLTVTRPALNATFASATTVPCSMANFTTPTNAVNLSLTYAPSAGTNLMVVRNPGLGFISGRFSNLAQGQVVTLPYNNDTYRFVVNYYGG
ncbi:MAG: cadherin-like beta sandwich domain-containing protein, partial [Verrucomicrobiota bacterium]